MGVNMLRIGEFVELSSITINMLRNYDKIGLLVPRYIDNASGYRYYDKEQLLQANQILALKEMGFGLDEIKKIMMQAESDINSFLEEKLKRKYEELVRTNRQIEQIKSVLESVDKNGEDYALQIVRKKMHSMWVASLTGQIDIYSQEGIMWEKLSTICAENKISVLPNAMAMAIYRGIDEKSGKLQIEVQFSIDNEYKVQEPLKIFKKEEKDVASVVFRGNYLQIGSINTVVANWLENNNLEINGEAFTIYHKSPENCQAETDFVTELCFPVNEKN